jgi:hypothetical protein
MKPRNLRNLALVAGAALLLCSCIPSVNPFYTDKDVVFDSRLVGQWRAKKDSDEPALWKFEKGDNQAYKLTVVQEKTKEGHFSAHLFKLKDDYFLDLIPTDCDYATNQADLVGCCLFPGHLVARVPQLGPDLQLAFSDFDWLDKFLKANPDALAHRTEDNSVLLTAGTRDLQKFILKHLGTNELFKQPGELARLTNGFSALPHCSGHYASR